jgi:hypothetical protein
VRWRSQVAGKGRQALHVAVGALQVETQSVMRISG